MKILKKQYFVTVISENFHVSRLIDYRCLRDFCFTLATKEPGGVVGFSPPTFSYKRRHPSEIITNAINCTSCFFKRFCGELSPATIKYLLTPLPCFVAENCKSSLFCKRISSSVGDLLNDEFHSV